LVGRRRIPVFRLESCLRAAIAGDACSFIVITEGELKLAAHIPDKVDCP
jgi:hypothetical protein